MSSDAVSWAYEQDVPKDRKFVLVAIADHANPSGVCFPGHARLAAMCNCDPSTITRAMRHLEGANLIARIQRRRSNGSRTSDWVVLAPHRPSEQRLPMREPAEQEHYPEDVLALFASPGTLQDESPCTVQAGSPCIQGRVTLHGGGDQNPKEPESKQTSSVSSPVELVYREWIAATERDGSRTPLTDARRTVIRKALASHGLEDCLIAVRNIGLDTWARGANDRGKRYDDIKHALGSAERIERWRDSTPPVDNRTERERLEEQDVAVLDRMMRAAA
jgi:hypothetical protein